MMMHQRLSVTLLATLLVAPSSAFAPSSRQHQTTAWTPLGVRSLDATTAGFTASRFPQQASGYSCDTRLFSDASLSVSDSNGDNNKQQKQSSVSGTGTATIPDEVFNLIKAIVGAGVLTLPSGIAAFANAPSAIVPANILIVVLGALSAYGFGLIGRVCSLTQTTSYRSAWQATVGDKSSWIPAWSVTLKTLFATLAYSMILGDTFYSLLSASNMIPGLTKTMTLTAVTSLVLLPLCLLKNLSSLAPFSLLGSLGMVYTAIAMGIRYFGGAYASGGLFAADLPATLRPAFGSIGAAGALSTKVSILIGMLSTSFMCHFNAPKFYTELKDNTVPRFMTVVASSFAVSIGLFTAMTSLGFLTFGAHSSGLILNNYSNRDTLMGLSRAAVAIAIVGSYPLAFVGARDGVLDLLKVNQATLKPALMNGLTVGMLSALTVAALSIPDVSFVLAFAGATLGNALIYVYPAIMFRGAIKKLPNPTKLQKVELKASAVSAVLGLVFGTMGAIKAVQSIL